MKKSLFALFFALLCASALAKIPAPVLSEEAKAKAAEAAAKTAWSGKLESYLLCKYQDQAAANYFKTAAANGKTPKPVAALPACVDVGPFVYTPGAAPTVAPTAAVSTPAPAAAAVPAAVPAAAAPAAAKKS